MISSKCAGRAAGLTSGFANLLLIVLLTSCGEGDKKGAGSRESATRPEDGLRQIASRPDRPPGLPSTLIGRSDRPQTRIFRKLRSEDLEELETLAANYREASDPYERIAAIEAMGDKYSEELLRIIEEALGDENAEVRAAALGVLAGSSSTAVVPVAKRALSDPDESVRLAVPDVLRNVPDLAVLPVFTEGLKDASAPVRYAFIDAANEMGPEIREPVLEAGLLTGDEEMRDLSLSLLKMEISHSAFGIIIEALDSPDPDFRESVSMQVDLLVGQSFANSAEARAWWVANKDHYDEELFLKE